LTEMNNITHNAHDAMGDVEATMKITKILQKKANIIWDSALNNSTKIDVDNFLNNNNVVCMDEYFFGKFNTHVVTYLCKNHFNYPQCFDLLHDPVDYFDMSIKDLKIKIKQRPKLIREIKNNKNPVLLDASHIEKIPLYKSIGIEVLHKRAEMIKNNPDFKNKIQRVIFEENEEKEIYKSQIDLQPEDSLYFGGFPDNNDKSKMLDFHNADWEEKFYISCHFKDQRYKYFAQRLIYEEAPLVLPKSDYDIIHKIIAKQILSTDNEKWNTIPKSYHELDTFREQFEIKGDDEKLLFLEELDKFLQDLEKKYQ
jgi:exodeoxyribonuclease-1